MAVIALSISTQARCELRDITAEIRSLVARWADERQRRDGALLLFSPHTTCGLTINEGADPDVRRDMVGFFGRLVPQFPERFGAPAFAHAEENSDAHIKTSLFGPQLLLPVSDGRLCLGRWQAVYLCEADGPRRRPFPPAPHPSPENFSSEQRALRQPGRLAAEERPPAMRSCVTGVSRNFFLSL